MLTSTAIPIPSEPGAFESACLILFAKVVNDQNIKKYGTRGGAQSGIDLLGYRDGDKAKPVGVQCKLRTKGDKLTRSEAQKEITAALARTPPLSEYYLIYTANDDPDLDALAEEIVAAEVSKKRSIAVHIWGWDTATEKIRGYDEALRAFDPHHSATLDRLLSELERRDTDREVLLQIQAGVQQLTRGEKLLSTAPEDPPPDTMEAHLDRQIDDYRELINSGEADTALTLLRRLLKSVSATASARILARIEGNIGAATLRLGNEADAAEALSRALELDPENPRHVANHVIALALSRGPAEAYTYAMREVAGPRASASLVGHLLQVAAEIDDSVNPEELIPQTFAQCEEVVLGRAIFRRIKGDPSWRDVAQAGREAFPANFDLRRFAAEAEFTQILETWSLAENQDLPRKERTRLAKCAAELIELWNERKGFAGTDRQYYTSLAINAANAARAIGDADSALRILTDARERNPADVELQLARGMTLAALDRKDEAAASVELLPESGERTALLMAHYANRHDWLTLITLLTQDRIEQLSPHDRETANNLLWLAARKIDPEADLRKELESYVEANPGDLSVLIMAASEALRLDRDWARDLLGRAVPLLRADSGMAARSMLAQGAATLAEYDLVRKCLDGFVSREVPSDELEMLATAHLQKARSHEARKFFDSLGTTVKLLPQYRRLIAYYKYNLGRLKEAEEDLRQVVRDFPDDLRSLHALASSLFRQNRQQEISDLVQRLDADRVRGTPSDRMALAQLMMQYGRAAEGLALAYRIASKAADDPRIVMNYFGILLEAEKHALISTGTEVEEGVAFVLSAEGERVEGVIETGTDATFITRFEPDHPTVASLRGKKVGELAVLQIAPAEYKEYRVEEITSKYVALWRHLEASFSVRFPQFNGFYKVTMKEGDISPVLDMIREKEENDQIVFDLYADGSLPLSRAAHALGRTSIEFAHTLRQRGKEVRTCVGSEDERKRAIGAIRAWPQIPVVIDALAAWTLFELDILGEVVSRAHVIMAQSSIDEVISWRATYEGSRGRDFMTMGWDGNNFVREEISAERVDNNIEIINRFLSEVQKGVEVTAVTKLNIRPKEIDIRELLGDDFFDAIDIAEERSAVLISEDQLYRAVAEQYRELKTTWIQPFLDRLRVEGIITDYDFARMSALLAHSRHSFVWSTAEMFADLANVPDEKHEALFDQLGQYIGGPHAEIQSHVAVVGNFCSQVWHLGLKSWQSERAIGRLTEKLVRHTGEGALAVLRAVVLGMSGLERQWTRAYLRDWAQGHFIDAKPKRNRQQKRRKG